MNQRLTANKPYTYDINHNETLNTLYGVLQIKKFNNLYKLIINDEIITTLDKNEIIIGREIIKKYYNGDLLKNISSQHCKISITSDNQIQIIDLQSRNGTFVNII